MKSVLSSLLVVVGASLAASRGYAQPPQDAEALWRDGVARYEKQDYEGARVAFLDAYTKTREARFLLNLGLSEMRSNHPVEALSHLKQYVKAADANPQKVEQVTKVLIPQAYGAAGHISVTAPAGSEVMLDGAALPTRAPLAEPVDVTSGKHVVEIRAGARSGRKEVEALAGIVVEASLELEPAPVAPTPSPLPREQPPPQKHTGAFSSARTIVPLGMIIGGLASVGGGVAFRLAASSQDDRAGQARAIVGPADYACAGVQSQPCSDLKDATDSSARDKNLSTAFLTAGGVLVVGAVVTWLLWPRSKEERPTSAAWVVPVVSREGASIGVLKSF